MKLEDIKAPEGFTIRGYQMPADGEYILCSNNVARKIYVDDFEYHCAVIVLDPVWEPEIGKYYEFSDYPDYSNPVIQKYVGNPWKDQEYTYEDESGERWNYMRPVNGSLGS